MSEQNRENSENTEIVQESPELSVEPIPRGKNSELTITKTSFWGPIPPPDVLLGYEKISPGFADRILSMAEKEGDHRRELEKVIVTGDNNRAYIGLFLGFIIALFGLGGSIYLGSNGKNWASGILGAATLTGLVTVFVTGKERRKDELEDKEK